MALAAMPPADAVTLGSSGTLIPRLGFGGCPMGQHGWGATDEQQLVEAVRVAFDHGVRFFDTADVYGQGTSERILGKALGRDRDRAIVATKFGVRLKDGKTFYDNSPKWMEEALHGSLTRLGTDCVDLYQLHYADDVTPLDEVLATLERFKEAGKIRYYGLTNVTVPPDSSPNLVSFSYEYSLSNRRHETTVLDTVATTSATFLSWGSLGQGVLTGKYSRDTQFDANDRRSRSTYVNFHGDRLAANLRIVEAVKDCLAGYPGRTISQLAIRWILDYVPRSVALVGMKNREQAENNCGALGWSLTAEDLGYLTRISAAHA